MKLNIDNQFGKKELNRKKATAFIAFAMLYMAVSCNNNNPASQVEQAGDTASRLIKMRQEIKKENLVIPGESVGMIRLGTGSDSLVNALGKPDAGDAAMGKSLVTWYENHDSTGNAISVFCSKQMGVDETCRIQQIRVTSAKFATKDGIHTGVELTAIQKYFDLETVALYDKNDQHYTIYDSKKGMAFEVNEAGLCSGLIVHDPSTTGGATYIPFYPGLRVL